MGAQITISSSLQTNPTPGFYPICYNDFTGNTSIFANSGLTNVVNSLPTNYEYLGLKFIDNMNFGQTLLEINPLDLVYTFGDAGYNAGVDTFAAGGLSIYPPVGEATVGCGISSPTNGVFRASGAQGFITIGNTPSTSVGVSIFDQSMRIGSNLAAVGPGPSDPTTVARWISVTDESLNQYYLPLYQ